jgi:release factor glutamine methyltransferase
MTVAETLKMAAAALDGSGVLEPRREAAGLLAFALDRDRTFLVAHPEHKLSEDEADRFAAILARRVDREPYHYIIGTREFYGLDFEVGAGILIPRPETELLVENAIEVISSFENPRFLEIGVGSGCIAVSVLKNVPRATAIGVDIAENALAVARRNSEQHGVTARLELAISDVYDEIVDVRFDAILSNPPYVPAGDIPGLQPEVRDFEPHAALTDGGDGLGIIRRIVDGAPKRLLPGGILIIEFGFGQSASVLLMYDRDIWKNVEIMDDMQGIPRTVISKLNG